MSPDASYVIGHEKGVGVHGNGPILLYDFWPAELAILVPGLLCTFPLLPKAEFTPSGILSIFVFVALLGLSIILGFQLYLRHRFRNLYSSAEFELLINKAKNRMGFSSTPELWLYPSSKSLLIPLSWFLTKAVILSDPAVEDLLASPVGGEVILADILRSLEGRPYLSTWGPLTIFLILSLLLFPWVGLSDQTARSILWFIYLSFVAFIGYGTIRPHKQKVDLIQQEYNIYSDIARCIVFRNEEPTRSELDKIVKQSKAPFPIPISPTRRGFSFIVATTASVFAWVVTQNFVIEIGLDANPFLSPLYITAPFLVALCCLVAISIGLDMRLARSEANQNKDV